MGTKSALTSEEKLKSGLIWIYHNLIAKSVKKKIGGIVCVICHFLKNESNYGKNREERTSATTINYRRAIFRVVSDSHDSADKIKPNLPLT